MTEEELKTFLEKEGYYNVRILPDGIIANFDMLFTTALIIDCDMWGYDHRYCYQDKELAIEACNKMEDIDDKPIAGWTALK